MAGLSNVFWVGSMSTMGVEAADPVVSPVASVPSEEVASSPAPSSREASSEVED
jgi:hypothetical protein